MSSRRAHTKSRRGCRRCKMSHIKCDEARPTCGYCNRKGFSCDLSNLTSSFSSTNTRALAYTPNPMLLAIRAPEERRLEMRLLHHYVHMASTSSNSRERIWTNWVTDLSIEDSSLMDAVLGFSAFHLRHLNPDDASLRQASHRYMAQAISCHRDRIKNGVNQDNAAVIFVGSILILFHATLNPIFLQDVDAKPEPQLPVHWFRPYQTASTVLRTVWPWVRNTAIGCTLDPPPEEDKPQRQQVNLSRFGFLLSGVESEKGHDAETVEAYNLTVANLSSIAAHPTYRNILRFPAMVPARFVELLEAQDPRTLAIIGYYFMLLKIACPVWWVRGAPEREFAAVVSFLPRDWWPIMHEAFTEFGWDEERSQETLPCRKTIVN